MRGRMFMAGITGSTDLSDALDVITAVMFEVPGKKLHEYRERLSRAVVVTKIRAGTFDRRTWGLQPEQIESTKRLMGSLGDSGGG